MHSCLVTLHSSYYMVIITHILYFISFKEKATNWFVIVELSNLISRPAMQVMVLLSLNSLSWKWVEREEEIGTECVCDLTAIYLGCFQLISISSVG
jgi:hypothetical protein